MPDEIPSSAEELRKTKIKRRLGYVVFGFLALYLSVPMLIGAITGVLDGEVWDPYTGHKLPEDRSVSEWCSDEARRLLQDAGKSEKLTRKWEEPARHWNAKCRDSHPGLYQVLRDTRRDLKQRKSSTKEQ